MLNLEKRLTSSNCCCWNYVRLALQLSLLSIFSSCYHGNGITWQHLFDIIFNKSNIKICFTNRINYFYVLLMSAKIDNCMTLNFRILKTKGKRLQLTVVCLFRTTLEFISLRSPFISLSLKSYISWQFKYINQEKTRAMTCFISLNPPPTFCPSVLKSVVQVFKTSKPNIPVYIS